jgi:NAD-dependent SIR2 family protein deacetylase
MKRSRLYKGRPPHKPYSAAGIKRVRCFRCGDQAAYQWQACANGSRFLPVCAECDIAINALVLEWMDHPHREQLLEQYAIEKRAPIT